MKHQVVTTVTSNEQHVRLKIFDGEIPLSDAGKHLLDIYRRQIEALTFELRKRDELIRELNEALYDKV